VPPPWSALCAHYRTCDGNLVASALVESPRKLEFTYELSDIGHKKFQGVIVNSPRSNHSKVGAIMDDPKDCREQAARCIEMANGALNVRMQSLMFDMANIWLKLAVELERGEEGRERRHFQPISLGRVRSRQAACADRH
jgi:hypothetical protein